MPLVNEHTAACGEIIYDVELGESSESPMDAMVEDAQMLETAGCSSLKK